METKRAGVWGLVLALGLGLGLLMGCAAEESTAAGDGPGEVTEAKTGRAQIRLPSLPTGFLAKRSAGAVDSPDVAFILTISGGGMVTRKQAWNLAEGGGTVTVEKIPVGMRQFKGELEVNGHVTHEDSVFVEIVGGRTAQVNLKLVSNRGDAVVCVEIDGLPPPPGCFGGPVLPVSAPNLAGCYRFDLIGDGFSVTAGLRIHQRDSLLTGILTWADGLEDSAYGTVRRDGSLTLGVRGFGSSLYLEGRFDTLFREIRGEHFQSHTRGYVGHYAATSEPCLVTPGPIVDSTLSCYSVSQTFENGARFEGTLVAQERSDEVIGVFSWADAMPMPVSGAVTYSGGGVTWHLGGVLPSGFYDHPSHPSNEVRYMGRKGILALHSGAIYWSPDILGYAVGSWAGAGRACQVADAHRLRAYFSSAP